MKKLLNVKNALFLSIFILPLIQLVDAQEISPWLFGQNHWMERSDEGKRPGYLYMLWPKVEESGIKLVRIGGGGYNRRFPARDKLTGIIDSIQGIGAEPILQVPESYTSEQTKELITHFNKSDREPVKFWSIGNEPLLHNRGNFDRIYDYVVRIATALKEVDPAAKVFAFDECDLFVEAHQAFIGGRLDITGKDKNGNWLIDGIAYHKYPNITRDYTRNDVVFKSPQTMRKQFILINEMLDVANQKHGRTGDAKLLWGLTEMNVSTYNPDRDISGIGNASFLGGQFFAEIYGLGMEYNAFTVAPWCINETDRIRTDFGYIGLPEEFYPRSSYYHTQMMALNMKGKFLPSKTSNSFVKSIASISGDHICVMILNQSENDDFEFDLMLNGEQEPTKALNIFADASIDASISGSILNQTTLLYVLNSDGSVIKTFTYGLEQNMAYLPPKEQYFKSPDALIQNKRLGRSVNIIGYDPFWKNMEYARFQTEHFEIIKEGGFNSIRVNIHPFKFMDKADNYSLPPSWFDKLDWVLDHALAQDLMVILDFHEFNAMAENPVEKKDIFLSFWEQVAPNCKYLPSNVVFELLNEPNKQLTPELWNEFLKEALAIVRETNPDRTVIIGPGNWNQIPYLEKLELPEDDRNIIVTIHYYSPHEFTHQGAPWSGEEAESWIGNKWGSEKDKAAVKADFQIAKKWSDKNNRPIFLGEFGVYDKAPMEYRVKYTSYVARLAEELGFSWAYWQFDSDFIVYDIDNEQWNKPIYRALIPSEK